jgi:amino acid adenylation domain-containing protein
LPVDWAALEDLPAENLAPIAGEDDLCYIIYTSGSTGRPKGVMVTRGSLASAYVAYEEAYRLPELTCHLQMASFSFDVFTGDLIRSLPAGARLVLCDLETVVDPERLLELMEHEGVDAAEFVPATATLLFDYAERSGRQLDFMRLIVVSSEAWRNEHYDAFRRHCGPRTRLVNAYGVTEATIDSTWYEPPPDARLIPGRYVPIGRPLVNTRAYLLGPGLEPAPVGVPAELCIGGPAVAQGYLNRPELTAERFVADPFSDDGKGRLYRTGDLARWLADGTIEFLGRLDRQLKIRGFRIEPGEIEAVLERHPSIRAAAVVDRRDPDGDARLVAYIEHAKPDGLVAASDLREFAAARVPGYMVPATYVTVERLPLTPNGKVDLAALPEPAWTRAATANEFAAPSTALERTVAGIWSDVLGIERIGVDDNFFALGGHSLLGMQVMSRLRDELGVALSLRAVFESPTVAGLAAAAQGAPRQPENGEPALVRLDRTPHGPESATGGASSNGGSEGVGAG